MVAPEIVIPLGLDLIQSILGILKLVQTNGGATPEEHQTLLDLQSGLEDRFDATILNPPPRAAQGTPYATKPATEKLDIPNAKPKPKRTGGA